MALLEIKKSYYAFVIETVHTCKEDRGYENERWEQCRAGIVIPPRWVSAENICSIQQQQQQ